MKNRNSMRTLNKIIKFQKPMTSHTLQEEIFSSVYNVQNRELLSKASLMANNHAEEILDNFYKTLTSHEETNKFLSSDLVETRLKNSLKKWLQALFTFDSNANFSDFFDEQKRIGEVHARILVPLNYVYYSVDNLKQHFYNILLLKKADSTENIKLINIINRIIDLAAMVFNDVYFNNFMKQKKNEQSLRNHYISQDLALEFEQSRADLLHWHRELLTVLFHPYSKTKFGHIVSIKQSKFGLWLDHRASLLFYNKNEVQQLQDKLADIDLSLEQVLSLNEKANWEKLAEETENLNNLITSTDWLLAQVSKDLAAMENSKDPLTRMFTRRYLPSIIQQEIRYCLENNVLLGVIMVDLDHFKKINDQFGHAAGDMVLKHTASILQASIRAYDYIFRYGGEEFIILINNTDQASCLSIAEEIRRKIEQFEDFELPPLKKSITISLGVALFDKHPDYELLIKHADDALYSAKEKGRNRVELYSA